MKYSDKNAREHVRTCCSCRGGGWGSTEDMLPGWNENEDFSLLSIDNWKHIHTHTRTHTHTHINCEKTIDHRIELQLCYKHSKFKIRAGNILCYIQVVGEGNNFNTEMNNIKLCSSTFATPSFFPGEKIEHCRSRTLKNDKNCNTW